MEYRVSGIGRAPARLVRAQALVAMCACATLAFTCVHGNEASLELTAFENPVPMAATAVVTGRVYSPLTTRIELTVNDTVIPIEADSTFRAEIALAPGALFHPVVAELRSPLGLMDRDRTVLITGDSIADGQPSPRSAALRINSAGLERIAPGMASLLDFDLAALLPHKKKISNRCLVDTFVFGCAGRAKVKVDNPPPKVSGWSIDLEPGPGFVDAVISAHDIRIHLQLNGSGVIPDCNFRLTARRTDIFGSYRLLTDEADPLGVRVEQDGPVLIDFTGFDTDYTGGACKLPVLDEIFDRVLEKLEPLVAEGLEDFLADPDGPGPDAAPIAAAVEAALDDLEISGPLGVGLGVDLQTPLVSVRTEPGGITFELDAKAISSRRGGLAACDAPPNALDLAASYHAAAELPRLGPVTPDASLPYDLGLAISASAFNQLLKARTECGLLHEDLHAIDLGSSELPLTAGLLAGFIPAFDRLSPNAALSIELRPRAAPILASGFGPRGEIGELQIADLRARISNSAGSRLLEFAVDASIGLELSFDADRGALAMLPGGISPSNFEMVILYDALGVETAALASILPELFGTALAGLTNGLGSLPLPRLLDLETRGVEITRMDDAIAVFLEWVPVEAEPAGELPPGLAFTAMTFNAGTAVELGHDIGSDPYTRAHAEIADELYENSLSWNPAESALQDFIALHRPDVLAFQELFYDPWCETIPVDPSLDFVCQGYRPARRYQIERLLGGQYQIACAADVSVSVTAPDGQPDNCVAVHRDFGRFPDCPDPRLCIDALVGLPPPDGCTRRPRVASIEVELVDGRRFTLINVHGTSGIADEDRACREQQFRQIFVDRGDGTPEASGAVNLILGDLNTDPFTAAPFDESAELWNEFVGPRHAFDYLSPSSASAPASYLGLFHVDHVVSDGMVGDCVIPGVSQGTEPVMDVVYWDHSPVLCNVLLPDP